VTLRTAVVFDFGGVLTTSVFGAFRGLGRELGDPELPLRLLGEDPASQALLVEHEEGRLSAAAFESGFAGRLRAHGARIPADGALLRRVMAGMRPEPRMLDFVAGLRARGVPVGLLSNALGEDCYAGFDLPALFDAVTLSSEIGARKPSRRAYQVACARLGVAPEAAVMVDDLRQNVEAARRLGMAAVLHRDVERTRAEVLALLPA
jgi:putative hydrolase of the HAD superfamily